MRFTFLRNCQTLGTSRLSRRINKKFGKIFSGHTATGNPPRQSCRILGAWVAWPYPLRHPERGAKTSLEPCPLCPVVAYLPVLVWVSLGENRTSQKSSHRRHSYFQSTCILPSPLHSTRYVPQLRHLRSGWKGTRSRNRLSASNHASATYAFPRR